MTHPDVDDLCRAWFGEEGCWDRSIDAERQALRRLAERWSETHARLPRLPSMASRDLFGHPGGEVACPYCGMTDFVCRRDPDNEAAVQAVCQGCGMRGPFADTEAEAVAAIALRSATHSAPPALTGAPGELTRDELLVLLMEECAEVIQAASKCLRFGYEHHQPGYGINCEVLAGEIGDVSGVVDALAPDPSILGKSRAGKIAKAIRVKAEITGPQP